jgi:hypothetical protein
MNLAGRPPVGLGITSGGNVYGNTEVTFTDLLGDKQISFYAQSISLYRTIAVSYLNIENRLQYALQGFSMDFFYYGNNPYLYDPALAPFVDRDSAESSQTQRGATAFMIYPFTKFTRLEFSGGYIHLGESYTDPLLQELFTGTLAAVSGRPVRQPHLPERPHAPVRSLDRARDHGVP